MNIPMTEVQKAIEEAHKDGLKEGIARFAYFENGVQYVGTTGMTLKTALAEVDKEGRNEDKSD